MSNPWARLSKLISPGPKTIVAITTVNQDGTSTATLRSGETIRVQGDNVPAGSKAIIQAGKIVGKAPDLPHYDVEV